MKVLAIDSTAVAASAAVISDGNILAQYTRNTGHTHSETLLPMAESVLSAAGLKPDDIDLYAVAAGPGSFTGVRIGISMIKGLAFGTGKPIAAVSSMDSLALNLQGFSGIACPVMDARRNQVYTAVFKDGIRITEDLLIPLTELKELLSHYDCPIRFTGDGYELAHKSIDLPNIEETPLALRLQSAVSVALKGEEYYKESRNIYTDTELKPIYLRASQAERERLAKEKGI